MKITPDNVRAPSHVQFGRRLIDVPVGNGLDLDHNELAGELHGYVDILLARADAPVDSPYLDLQECASGYLARALEMEMTILDMERNREVPRGHPLNKFRTGSLRSFIEMAKTMVNLGSRRLSQEKLLSDQRYDYGDS